MSGPVKILVDCRYTRLEHHDGISRYTARLVASLAKLHPVTMLISDERQLTMLPDLPYELATDVTSAHEPWVAKQVNAFHPDVVFTPMQTMGGGGRQYALVKTLHDLIYYRNRTPPRDLAWPIRLLWRLYHLAWWPQRLLLNQADEVVTISQTSKSLIERHRLTKRPISIVRNAADPVPGAEQPRVMPPADGPRDLVYMGSFMPYKNVETLVAAVALLPGYRLHLLSRIGEADRARLARLAPADQLVFHDGVTDDEYQQLLRGATALVHASLDEGFGIPLIEAMSVGTPIVVSDIPIFREVGADAAGYFSPKDAADAARAVRALDDPVLWRTRSDLGRIVASAYDWDASAADLLVVLERASTARKARQTRARRR